MNGLNFHELQASLDPVMRIASAEASEAIEINSIPLIEGLPATCCGALQSIAKSQLQNSSYALSIWLAFDEIQNCAGQNRFLEAPYGLKAIQHTTIQENLTADYLMSFESDLYEKENIKQKASIDTEQVTDLVNVWT